MTNTSLIMAALLALACQSAAFAATNASSPPSGGNAAFEAAMAACSAATAKDSRGGPDMAALDACMQTKGFTRPAGPPPGENKPGQR
ncbi:MAG: hypothetical protein P4L87_02670 [Formivibrio sp.]|nr:hypothetical protein [Formivibrio sp.]